MTQPTSKTARSTTPRKPRLALDGVLLLDKPLGLSSNDALVRAKRLLNAQKAGHTGTLDPLATGLLPLCFGEATKFSQDLLGADKTYEAEVRLGSRTTTGDAEGEVTDARPVTAGRDDILRILAQFRGDIDQIPPMYSALKRDGKPLYEYARAGQTIERAARRVTIHRLELLDCALPAEPVMRLRVVCSKGTYIRTLAEDIGEALGCGAHLSALRRTGVGNLTLDGAMSLAELEAVAEEDRAARLAPTDALLRTLPAVTLDGELARRFSHGQRLRLSADLMPALHVALPDGKQSVRVYGPGAHAEPHLLGVASCSPDGLLVPQRLLATRNSPA